LRGYGCCNQLQEFSAVTPEVLEAEREIRKREEQEVGLEVETLQDGFGFG